MTSFNLEQSARELTEAIAKGPPLSGVTLADARKAVEAAQSAPIPMPDIEPGPGPSLPAATGSTLALATDAIVGEQVTGRRELAFDRFERDRRQAVE